MSSSSFCSSRGIIFSVVEEVRNTQVNYYIGFVKAESMNY